MRNTSSSGGSMETDNNRVEGGTGKQFVIDS